MAALGWEPLLAIVVLGAWSAVLMNRGIATFHDGLRPVVSEWVAGRISRSELNKVALTISPNFVTGSMAASAAIGITLTGLILIATDLIGAVAGNLLLAAIGGGFWSGLVFLVLSGLFSLSAALPVPILEPLRAIGLPLIFLASLVPAVALGYQFGPRGGVITAALSLAGGYLLAGPLHGPLGAEATTLLLGLGALVGVAVRSDRRAPASAESVTADPALSALFAANTARLRRHLVPLMIQGALLGMAIRWQLFGWMLADGLASATGHLIDAAAFALLLVAAFLPLLTTGALGTGVTQAIGLGLVFPVAYLSPNVPVAAVAGALTLAVEVHALGALNEWLDRHPTVRESADSLRTAMEKVGHIALLAGSMLAAGALLPGTLLGYVIVGGAVVLNEIGGRTWGGGSVALLAAIAVGVLANVLAVSGLRITG
jgi:hypothetical protein